MKDWASGLRWRKKTLGIDRIFAYLIVLGIIGFLIDLSLRMLLRVTCKWAVD